VCNLYSITTNQDAITAMFGVVHRYIGNLAVNADRILTPQSSHARI
jgi:hypothetical protein